MTADSKDDLLQGTKVFVVEDEAAISMLLEDMLLDFGCEVVGPAARLTTALEMAENESFDVAILDVNVAGEPIYPVAEAIVKRDLPIVFSTGYGGAGITIGPECSPAELDERAEQLRAHPDHFIAQDIVRLSTLPTYAADESGRTCIHPRHVDLRAFVHVRATKQPGSAPGESGEPSVLDARKLSAHTVPAALTRTAPAGSLIVNTSRGGGGKDTWILRSPAPTAPAAASSQTPSETAVGADRGDAATAASGDVPGPDDSAAPRRS